MRADRWGGRLAAAAASTTPREARVRAVERAYVVLLGVIAVLSLIVSGPQGGPGARSDILFVTGVVAFVAGLAAAYRVPPALHAALRRLEGRGVLQPSAVRLSSFLEGLERRAGAAAHAGGIVLAVLMAAGAMYVYRVGFGPAEAAFALLLGGGGYLGGRHIGRFVAYGTLPGALRREGIAVAAQPGHVDGAAGLKPLGDFYFLQAGVLAIPAAFFAAWLAVMLVAGVGVEWKRPYMAYLAVMIVVEVLAFVLPLWSFRRGTQRRKEELLARADTLAAEIARTREELAGTSDKDRMAQLRDYLANLTQAYEDIETMPTWPVDAPTRRRFTVRNALLLLPLVTSLVTVPEPLKGLLTALGAAFGGPPA